ncbi:hypothetical protein [Nocardioides hwasunensis]|uniref:Roadblock/LAMTOR2 domain-containing protein n=1 Tax=Nocardioides hwasunensis TaxID=397258 RepID=A0ABR8MJ78_9ACTN|nr:hypothetical protein [Nocardioides hwasunensis]MBD3916073.1 hypothetical protein [Nocardioides hwasunensis]
MTTERIPHPGRWATQPAWPGRASRLRRQQVMAGTHGGGTPVQELWASLTEVLSTLDSPASAMLCTLDGFPVASHGYVRADLVHVARLTGRMFLERRQDVNAASPRHAGAESGVETVEHTTGPTQSVIASISAGQDRYLLSVAADDVSMPVLEAWTREAADQLRTVLLTQS